MSSSEIAFLALGLVLGAALGAALAHVVRSRPASRREIRLTITANAIPARRAQTLSIPPSRISSGPTAGTVAPGDAGAVRPVPAGVTAVVAPGSRPDAAAIPPSRTRVPSGGVVLPSSAVAVPIETSPGAPDPGTTRDARHNGTSPRPPENPGAKASVDRRAGVAIAIPATAVAVMDAPARPRPAVAPPALLPRPGRENGWDDEAFSTLVRPHPPVKTPGARPAPGDVPVADPPAARPGARAAARPGTLVGIATPALAPPSGPTLTRPRASSPPPASPGPGPAAGPASPAGPAGAPGASTDPCSGQRRAVEERCALADVAREQGRRVANALREAQRAYDVLRDRVDRAEAQADPRRVAAAKEGLHAAFREGSDAAGTAEQTEAAARLWLTEINTLNNAVRDAQRTAEAGNAELRSRIGALERLSAEADAARIAGENAEAGCREAREDLAGCEEADARAQTAVPRGPQGAHPIADAWPEDSPDMPDRPSPAERMAGLPLIVRVLRGDRDARDLLIATLAAGDAETTRDWGLRVSRLVDAIVGRATEDGYLDLPEDDAFWRLFSHAECRDIVGALSALGFRYDGMGGFADGRSPAARDLSLAVGYAGLDRMRIRTWPRDSKIASLYEGGVIAADEWLADQAGDLSLGRMVDALGNRAADLADVWNAWGRVRPALLST